jgi:hypothetical protein
MITTTNELGEKMLKDLTIYTSLARHYMDQSKYLEHGMRFQVPFL